jgi:hypothetical protein
MLKFVEALAPVASPRVEGQSVQSHSASSNVQLIATRKPKSAINGAINECPAINRVAINAINGPALAINASDERTPNRRERTVYNAYMADYMRRWRLAKSSAKPR